MRKINAYHVIRRALYIPGVNHHISRNVARSAGIVPTRSPRLNRAPPHVALRANSHTPDQLAHIAGILRQQDAA
ncbi:MAG: hypothetical protein NTNFB01_25650 [Nitrospira sp.]|jgi:hypothetical protein